MTQIPNPSRMGALPSEKQAAREENKAARDALRQEQADKIRGALRRVGETEDGKILYRYLYDECLGNRPIIAKGTIEVIDEKATLYQAFRQSIWINIRRMLTFNILKEIEYEQDQF